MRRLAVLVVSCLSLLSPAACSRERRLCKVNDQCFVCADDKSLTKCVRDPSTARCKWTPPSDCH
jgi:hypothetical protein